MHDLQEGAGRFMALHHTEQPLLLANAWDAGSAGLFASLGFRALATTSSGHAASLGRLDYEVGREQTLAHAATLAAATDLPLSADLQDCFGASPDEVAETVAMASTTGLAGCSIEDWSSSQGRLYAIDEASERVAAAAAAAHAGPARLVLTARAENHLRGVSDLHDTIERLQAYQRAGADVLYAPGLISSQDIRSVVSSVDAPVNVLVLPGVAPIAQLNALGVRRVSVGGWFAYAALAGATAAAAELLGQGTYGFLERAAAGSAAARAAFAA